MKIREATPADARAIAQVHTRSWQVAYRGLIDQAYLDSLSVDDGEKGWEERLESDGAGVWVACEGMNVVGFASVGPSPDDDDDPQKVGHLFTLYVAPENFGGGAGAALLEEAVTYLREAGFREATLWVLDNNAGARRFYERHGWGDDGGRKDCFGKRRPVEAPVVRYRRRLD
ncbi:MAG: GNAT family N-acetyltransferase [Actinomycetota bacterium]